MLLRKEIVTKQYDQNGNAYELKFIDGGILPEDQIILFAKHSLYKVTTGEEKAFPDMTKEKKFLLRFFIHY